MNLGIDVDGVLADFNSSFLKALIDVTGRTLIPTFTTWNWDLECGYTEEESHRAWKEHILEVPDFWTKMKPYPHAKAVVRQLNRLEKGGMGVFFITNRMGFKPRVQTEEWLYEQGMNYPAVIIASQKTPIIKSLGIEWYVDDRFETMVELHQFDKKHFYLLDATYNQHAPTFLKRTMSVEDAMREANLWMDAPTKSS